MSPDSGLKGIGAAKAELASIPDADLRERTLDACTRARVHGAPGLKYLAGWLRHYLGDAGAPFRGVERGPPRGVPVPPKELDRGEIAFVQARARDVALTRLGEHLPATTRYRLEAERARGISGPIPSPPAEAGGNVQPLTRRRQPAGADPPGGNAA